MTSASYSCPQCGTARPADQPRCPACGHQAGVAATVPAGEPAIPVAADRPWGPQWQPRSPQQPGSQPHPPGPPSGAWSPPASDATAMPALSQVLRSPPSRRAVRRAAAILAAAVVVAVGLIVLNGLFTPERAAEGFLAALANRDFDDARARLAVQPGTAGPLLESARLTDDGYTPPRRARVESVQVGDDGNSATARVAFEIGGSTGVTELQLVRSGRSLLLFPRWQVQGGQYTVSVTAPNATEVEVAGVRVAANVAVPAFPGSYQAQLPDNPLLEAAPVTAYALADAPPAELVPSVKATARDQVGRQITDYLTKCAGSTELEPPGCPFGTSSSDPVTGIRWRIQTYPETTVEATADGIVLSTASSGQADVTGMTQYSDGTSYPFSDTVSFDINGRVTLENGAVRWQPGD
jgi:hypothetical protein